MRTYQELITIPTFKERFEYLKLNQFVAEPTFAYDRYLNQMFYRSPEWRRVRRDVIIRDNGCDLALDGYEIYSHIYIHHMNPIEKQDIIKHSDEILDPNYLVCVSFDTHNAIHYGDYNLIQKEPIERMAGDTKLW